MNQNKTPQGANTFTRGAPVSPAAALQSWLDTQKHDGEPKLLRLPIVLAKGAMGFGTANAKIGTGADVLTVFLDDSALGVGIADKVRACNQHPTCAMIVEGYWQGKGMGGDLEVKVMKADVVELASLTAYAEVESPGPNSN
ncbi:MAG: hypothetical protein NT062_13360 [Proteobacteria bacterium]|nr:hypothetical protein [Pseudomonadota bacterium]